jgi:hypothetical protein
LLLIATSGAMADSVTVRDTRALREAVNDALPGAEIRIAPGDYDGGSHFADVKGTEGKPIVIRGADPKNPPRFRGGNSAMHFTDAEYLEISDLVVEGASANGLNFDDGGTWDSPSRGIVLRNLKIADTGDRGNQDGIKLSGIRGFRVENCVLERWGANGSGIDMVGCHKGVIEGCTFRHPAGSNGVQTKGGSSAIVIRKCRFDDAGSRAINLGGSTGLEFFRPALASPPFCEALDITVEGNTFTGSDAPVAFVGADRAVVRYNTIYLPRRWAMRILQETTAEGFVPCRKGEFSHNIVVFRSDAWSEGGVNAGPGTEPSSFTFARNAWYCLDAPARSRPKLPAGETNGAYGTDPQLADPEKGEFGRKKGSPVMDAGADALPE